MNYKKISGIILTIILIFIIFSINKCNNDKYLNSELKRIAHNEKVKNDSIVKYYSNKTNKEVSSKLAYILTIDELKKQNSNLSKELDNVNGNVKTIIKTEIHYIYSDTIIQKIKDTIKINNNNTNNFKDSLINFDFEQTNEFNFIKGSYKINLYTENDSILNIESVGLFLDTFLVNANIVLGFEELDKEFRVFAYSSNPNVYINQIESALIIQKKTTQKYNFWDRFGLGLNVGLGLNTKLEVLPTVSIGINYNFIEPNDIKKLIKK